MGAQSSSYSLLSASSVEQSWDHWEASEPAVAEHDDDDDEEVSQHDDGDDEEMPHLQRREAIDDSRLPYKCGLLFFYHIPSTGGSTINKWLLNFTPKGGGDIKYFTHWGGQHTIGGGDRVQNAFISGNDGGMNEFVLNLDPDEWRIAHCHHNSLHLNESEHYLESWRNAIEAQGCHFVVWRFQGGKGWIDKEMPRHNTHKGELTFTKEQVEELQMLLIANGDTDFIRQVKQIYDE
eukprot:scaffold145458_cov77-Cyclotella_meneghiniana.AAC.3